MKKIVNDQCITYNYRCKLFQKSISLVEQRTSAISPNNDVNVMILAGNGLTGFSGAGTEQVLCVCMLEVTVTDRLENTKITARRRTRRRRHVSSVNILGHTWTGQFPQPI